MTLDVTANAFDLLGPAVYGRLAASQNGRRALRAAAESGKAGGIALLRYAVQTGLVAPAAAEAADGGLTLSSLGIMPPPSPAFRSELRNQLPPAPVPPIPGLPMPQMTNTRPISSFSRDLLRSQADANRLQLSAPQPGAPTFGQQLAGNRRRQPR